MKNAWIFAFCLLSLGGRSLAALANPENDLTDPTAYLWLRDATEAEIRSKNGYRLTRLDRIPGTDRYNAVLVLNFAPYDRVGTDWTTNLTFPQVLNIESDQNRRIIDLSMDVDAAENFRFTVVWTGNTGAQNKQRKVLLLPSAQGIQDFAEALNMRIIDIEHVNHPSFSHFYSGVLVAHEPGDNRCQIVGESTIEDIMNRLTAVETAAAGTVKCAGFHPRLAALEHVGGDQFAYVAESRFGKEKPWWFADLNFSGINGAVAGSPDRIADPADMLQVDNLGTLPRRLDGRILDFKRYSKDGQDRYLAILTDNDKYLQSEARVTPSPTLDKIDQAMQDAMKTYGVPGGTIAITQGPRLVYAQGYGTSHLTRGETRFGQQALPTTMFRIASVSKSLTSLAILRLIQDGALTPIGDRLFTLDTKPFADIFPCGARCTGAKAKLLDLTVRQILQHKSYFHDDLAWLGSADQVMDHADPVFVKRDVAIAANPKNYKYQNGNYHLLTLIVEAVGRKSYSDYYQEKFLGPLGIQRMRISQARAQSFTAAAPFEAATYPNVSLHNRRCWDPGNVAACFGATPTNNPHYVFEDPADPNDWIFDNPVRFGAGAWAVSAVDILRLFSSADGTGNGTRVLNNFNLIRDGARLGNGAAGDAPVLPTTKDVYCLGLGQFDAGGKMAFGHSGYVPTGIEANLMIRDDGVKVFIAFNGDVAGGYNADVAGGKTITAMDQVVRVMGTLNNILNTSTLPSQDLWSLYGFAAATGANCAGVPAWSNTSYAGGAQVQAQGQLYRCKSGPESGWCGMTGYAPAVDQNWPMAWDQQQACVAGAIGGGGPTQDCAALPEWQIKTYAGGDRVQHGSNIYTCKGWPNSPWCGQAGYEPGVTPYWQDAWTLASPCAYPGSSGELPFTDVNHEGPLPRTQP